MCIDTVSIGGFNSFEGHLQFVKIGMCSFVCVVFNSPVFYLTNGIL